MPEAIRDRLGTRTAAVTGESGFALASVILLLFVILTVAGTVATIGITSLNETQRDRQSARAFQIADSAIDVTTWYTNRQLTNSDVQALIGEVGEEAAAAGCLVDVDASAAGGGGASGGGAELGFTFESNTSATVCPPVSVPGLPENEAALCVMDVRPAVDLSDPADLELNGETGVNDILRRQIVCQGEIGETKRRILAELVVQIDSGRPTSLFRRDIWIECAGEFSDLTDPSAGCPTPTA